MKNHRTINISFVSIVKFFLVVLSLYFLYLIKDVLALIFVALIFASAIDSWVDYLENKKIPRGVSVLLVYLVAIAIVGSAVVLIIPPIAHQVSELADNFPRYYEKVTQAFSFVKEYSDKFGFEQSADNASSISSSLTKAAGSIFSTVASIFGGLFSFLVILVITFYMTVEEDAIKRTLRAVLPSRYQDFVVMLINKIQKKIGAWLKGQLILSLIIGIFSYIGLLILGVKYALILALIAAIGEFIPYIGPIISSIPAIFLAFAQSPLKALLVLILFVIIQQLENHLLVPKIMQKAVGLNPIISVIALLIGAKVGGVIGAVLAIPVATAISILIKELFEERDALDRMKQRATE
ncbi:MAG TPA: AI-2E family transporter [Candidatus Bipolaricaulota bacterium]|nr:AI-2E family transporter [Candidatus Bipolaricaulota bacterium]